MSELENDAGPATAGTAEPDATPDWFAANGRLTQAVATRMAEAAGSFAGAVAAAMSAPLTAAAAHLPRDEGALAANDAIGLVGTVAPMSGPIAANDACVHWG